MNLFPLWTASVCPTNSGSTVERRAQVLSTRFSPLRFNTSIFLTKDSTTYGPFLIERATKLSLWLPAPHDEPVTQLTCACLHTLGDLSPWRAGMAPAGRLALAAAHRVVHRIHRHAAHASEAAQPAPATGFPVGDVLVVEIADLSDDRAAVYVELPHLARGKTQLGVVPLLGHQLAERAGA